MMTHTNKGITIRFIFFIVFLTPPSHVQPIPSNYVMTQLSRFHAPTREFGRFFAHIPGFFKNRRQALAGEPASPRLFRNPDLSACRLICSTQILSCGKARLHENGPQESFQ